MSWIDSMHSVYYWWIAKVINPTYQASGYIQDDSCRNMSYLCVHEVSSCETSHVWSYLRIDMHIDERYACMSKRTTHLYITRAMEVRAIDDHLVAPSVILTAASSSESSAALSSRPSDVPTSDPSAVPSSGSSTAPSSGTSAASSELQLFQH